MRNKISTDQSLEKTKAKIQKEKTKCRNQKVAATGLLHDVFLVKYQRLSDWIKQKPRRKTNSMSLTRNKLQTKGHGKVKNERSEQSYRRQVQVQRDKR